MLMLEPGASQGQEDLRGRPARRDCVRCEQELRGDGLPLRASKRGEPAPPLSAMRSGTFMDCI